MTVREGCCEQERNTRAINGVKGIAALASRAKIRLNLANGDCRMIPWLLFFIYASYGAPAAPAGHSRCIHIAAGRLRSFISQCSN